MLFKDYKHIELLEDDITIAPNRVEDRKLVKVKNWKPTNPFRLRVKATVVRGGKRTIKKRTFVYEGVNMITALEDAQDKLKVLIASIKEELKSPTIRIENDKDEMFTFEKAFYRSLESRKVEAEAEGEEFRSYQHVKNFYINHLKEHLGDKPLNQISTDTLNHIRANMQHKDGTPFSKRTKLTVLQNVNPVYVWFNNYSNLSAKSPAKITKGIMKKLGNERRVKIDDIAPLFNAMANYTFRVYGVEKTEPFRGIFVWLLHGRRVNEVLSLRWEDINLKAGTYTISAKNNKVKMDMTYKLTPYQISVLPEPKKSGIVFHAQKNKDKQIGPDVLWTHWKKVRPAVAKWTLNGKEVDHNELHMHDLRHIIATEMLNKYGIVDEISGAVLGHVRSGITARYAEIVANSVYEATMIVLDGVLI